MVCQALRRTPCSRSLVSECFLITADGRKRRILKTAAALVLDNRLYRLESFVDISERFGAEEVLRESEMMLLRIFENVPFGIAFVDTRTGAIEVVNREFRRIFGYSVNKNNPNRADFLERMYPNPRLRQEVNKKFLGMCKLQGTNRVLRGDIHCTKRRWKQQKHTVQDCCFYRREATSRCLKMLQPVGRIACLLRRIPLLR